MKTGIELITEKRQKHQSKGWSIEHDMEHKNGELSKVAATLAVKHTDATVFDIDGFGSMNNPWGLENNIDDIDRLAIAGSLIAAEIDRLQLIKKL